MNQASKIKASAHIIEMMDVNANIQTVCVTAEIIIMIIMHYWFLVVAWKSRIINTNLLVPCSNTSMTWLARLRGIGASHCNLMGVIESVRFQGVRTT